MYHYFVSFAFTSLENQNFGFGCCEIVRKTPILGITDIKDITDELAKSNPESKNYTILSYQLFSENSKPKKRRKKH